DPAGVAVHHGGAARLAAGARAAGRGAVRRAGGPGARPRRRGPGLRRAAPGLRHGGGGGGRRGVRGLLVPRRPVAGPPGRERLMMPVVKYTLARIGLLLAVLIVLFAVFPGLDPLVTLLLAFLVSFVLSWFVLRGWRDQMAQALAESTRRRREGRQR